MVFLVLAIVIGLIPAAVASSKGRSFLGWWIYGTLLWIVAMPHALLIRSNRRSLEQRALADGDKKCPYCAEMIKHEAAVCRFCHREQPGFATA